MAQDYNKIAQEILKYVGGPHNVANATNCMTRLRIVLKDPKALNLEKLQTVDGVLQVITDNTIIQVVLGPGKVVKVTDEFNNLISVVVGELGQLKEEGPSGLSLDANWRDNKAALKGKQKRFAWLTRGMRHLANIFSPLIPAIIAAGLFAALSSIIKQTCGTFAEGTGTWIANNPTAEVINHICTAFSNGFTAYLVIFVGVNTAKEFGASPMLGGFIGGICILENITSIGKLIHIPDQLQKGKGGVIGVIIAVWLLSLLERFLHKKMPNSLDTVLTPFLSILIIGLVYIFGIMIVTGYVSYGICLAISKLTGNEHVIVRIIVGFFSAALFLPLVTTGMHHGLVAFYSEEFATHQYVSLYPALAMAGAGQVGAAIALYIKGKRTKNEKLQKNITGSIVPGILGVGEPLIYSVTLPLGTPFITAGLGAGIGGAFIMAMRVASTAWGPSGFVAIPMMCIVNGKPNWMGMVWYTLGLLMSMVGGFLITYFVIPEKKVAPINRDPAHISGVKQSPLA